MFFSSRFFVALLFTNPFSHFTIYSPASLPPVPPLPLSEWGRGATKHEINFLLPHTNPKPLLLTPPTFSKLGGGGGGTKLEGFRRGCRIYVESPLPPLNHAPLIQPLNSHRSTLESPSSIFERGGGGGEGKARERMVIVKLGDWQFLPRRR